MTYEKDIPDFALVPAKQPEEHVRIPITQGAIYSPVQVTSISERNRTTILIEEDLLVPDTRPDLKEILDISGAVHLSNRESGPYTKAEDSIPLAGEIELQTLYLPEKPSQNCSIISTTSHISFREQWHRTVEEGTILTLEPKIARIDSMVVNERKYRVKITLSITARECQDQKLNLFEGIEDENIQTLRETVEMTSIPLRKKDIFSVREDISLKDDSAFPENILKQEISVVENYKQSSPDKAIINGFIYINLLYTSAASQDSDEADCNIHQLRDRIEFTQFIPLSQNCQWSGCSVTFDSSDLRIKPAAEEDGTAVLRLEGDITTWLELYCNTEKEIIIDGYHREKNFVCDFEEKEGCTLLGNAIGETTLRELVSLECPDSAHGEVSRILHICATVASGESHAELGKIITEGTLSSKIFALDTDGCVFTVSQVLPFRCVTAVSYLQGDETIYHRIYIKELWAEKVSSKQAEVNAGILVSCEILRPVPLHLLKNPCFDEIPGKPTETKPMVVYMVQEGDSLWSIAKKFKSTVDSIKQTNQIDDSVLMPGEKLLILQ